MLMKMINAFTGSGVDNILLLNKLQNYFKWSSFCDFSGGGRGVLEGLEPPQLSRKGGRAPPKLYVCDVINIS